MIVHIEEAIKKHLAGAKLPYLRLVASYGGQFGADIEDVIRSYPAVWVALKSEDAPKATGTGREIWHVPATWLVMVASRSIQNEASTRTGGLNVGTYQMLADVRGLLLMQDFGLPIQELRPGKTFSLFNRQLRKGGLSVLAQEWHTLYPMETRKQRPDYKYPELFVPAKDASGNETQVNLDGSILDAPHPLVDFLRIGMNYYLRPPRDGEDEPDLTDLLTLNP